MTEGETTSFVPPGKCRICSAPNESLHFGKDVCRACATFFKRAKQSGGSFPCRQGDHKCSLLRGSSDKCRGCRYDKCVEIGMVYDAPVRDINWNGEALSIDESSPEFRNDSVPDFVLTPNREDSLLERITREHAVSVERRRFLEADLVRKYNLERIHPSEEVYLTTHTSAIESYNLAAGEIYQFFLAVFPSVRELPYEDQRELFRLHFIQFLFVDVSYRTMRVWEGFVKYAFCSVLLCTDIYQPERWIGENEGGPKREEFLESMRVYIDIQKPLLLPSYEKAGLTEKEHYALVVLLLCESHLPNGMDDRTLEFLENIRREILEDLHHFYTEEMGLKDYSSRLGNLWTICHTFREGSMIFKEFFRMHVTIFDLYATETLLQELLL